MKRLSFVFIAMLLSGYGHAANMNNFYIGGGLGSNSLPGSSAGMGFQIFAGMDMPVKMAKGKLSVEAGYMDTGDMETSVTIPFFGTVTVNQKATGLWGTAVYSLPVQSNLNLIARAGLDIGDDDGFMFGVGAGYQLNPKMELRGEYVLRSEVDSLQVNFVMKM